VKILTDASVQVVS